DAARVALEPTAGLPPPFQVNHGSVDGHLALLALPGAPLIGVVANPLFRGESPLRSGLPATAVIRVARLDGPSDTAVRNMIDGALVAERDGLLGRAYVDFAEFYPKGEQWLEGIATKLKALGWPPIEHRLKHVLLLGDRA